ncbi:carboxypeptidase-like regulatory domain-containing protein [Algoriphagus sediminis]|uniref:Carboxypeptidase-like regulatory domain-containing protein n=1 Tax=Algoriphagus sediminis TaxID=3057113 RepID=A0ABT7YAS6_9BACT|nr:carboxypeptidase-like regulatory domain-containing protein [Algoriphagus sediminis]MDN3203546.1 carboxypeptidase-like regulatory domain-containing protein [Algoriphagus sediminis]
MNSKRVFLLLFFSLIVGNLYSQTIRGTVKDGSTGKFMPFCNVFINNTTIGTVSDENGFFEISRNDLPGTLSLVASFVGYETFSQEVSIGEGETKTVDFTLTPLESVLSEVELKSRRDKPWERNLKRFEKVFLALPDDPISDGQEILNPWVLEFEKVKPDKGPNYIQATAQQPLIIENSALGYKIEYYLQDYKLYKDKSQYFGLAFFEEIEPKDSLTKKQYQLQKETSYQGSLKHLMRSLLVQRADEQGFDLYITHPEQMDRRRTNTYTVELGESIVPLSQDSIRRIPLKNGNFRIIWPDRVEVHFLKKSWLNNYYQDIYHPVGWISAPRGYFDIDRNGVPIHPTQVVLSGYLGRPRMGRTLPHDFIPPQTFENFAEELNVVKAQANRWENLRERPYITTNKPYYFPGESVWLGGIMLYKNQFFKDSLSRLLYLEFRDSKSDLVFEEKYPIRDGKINGAFQLPDSLPPGDYFIKAYTEWMRNYPEKDVYQRAIPVLAKGTNIEAQATQNRDYGGDLVFHFRDSVFMKEGQKVILVTIELLDALDEPLGANFILSATDQQFVSSMDNQNNLIKAFEWLDEESKDPLSINPQYPIEYGITVEGRFTKSKKRQPDINPITIVRGDLADYGVVSTDTSGYFRATGLNFFEWDTLAMAALDEKRKPYGSVELLDRETPVFRGSSPKLDYSIYEMSANRGAYDEFGDFILLEEFVAEDEKIEAMEDRYYGYGDPNFALDSEDLDNWPGSTLDQVIGMRLGNGGNGGLGNYNFGVGAGDPLLIIDGFRYQTDSTTETASQVLQNYTTDEVKSIAIYTLNAPVFGLGGFAGVIMIETKRGDRFIPGGERNFNDFGFNKFLLKGYARQIPFPNEPNAETSLGRRQTLYWNPSVTTAEGRYEFEIYLPSGVNEIDLRLEGVTEDGLPFWWVESILIEKNITSVQE